MFEDKSKLKITRNLVEIHVDPDTINTLSDKATLQNLIEIILKKQDKYAHDIDSLIEDLHIRFEHVMNMGYKSITLSNEIDYTGFHLKFYMHPLDKLAQKNINENEIIIDSGFSENNIDNSTNVEPYNIDEVTLTEQASKAFKVVLSNLVEKESFTFEIVRSNMKEIIILFTAENHVLMMYDEIKKHLINLAKLLKSDLEKIALENQCAVKVDWNKSELKITSQEINNVNRVGALLKDAGTGYWSQNQLRISQVFFFKSHKREDANQEVIDNSQVIEDNKVNTINCMIQ